MPRLEVARGTINLGKVEARNRLAPRRDPYWQRIEAGYEKSMKTLLEL